MSVLILLTTATLCPAAEPAAQIINGVVIKIQDGDTITILDTNKNQHKIRLAQIDAPEGKQAFSKRSKQVLSDKIF